MKDRNITTVSEVMDAATGITVLPFDSERMNYYSRGFPIDAYQYDGVPIPRDGTWQFGDNNADMILYDHVEIVRGATGLMQGAGEPGASINYIRKRPTSFLRREVAAAVAYPTGGRAEADISGPLNESGTVRGRLLGAADAREGTLDRYFKERYVGYGALEFDLTDRTLLNLGVSYQETDADNVTWGGLPPWYTRPATLIDWPWGFNLGADWTYIDTQRTEAFASLEHVFDNGWTGRLVATHVENDFAGPARLVLARPMPGHRPGDRRSASSSWAAKYDGGYTQDSLNAVLNGDFQALGRIHQFVRRRVRLEGRGRLRRLRRRPRRRGPVGDVFDWDGSFPEPDFSDEATQVRYTTETTQVGLYGTTQFHATDALAVIAGARVNWWDGSARPTPGSPTFAYEFEGIVTPYLGFTYDINETYTAYGSITSIYKPQLVQDIDRNYLDPTFGWNYELGVKAGLFGGALYASAAVFQTDQKDVAELRRLHRGRTRPQRLRADRRHHHARLRDRGGRRDQRALERLARLHLRLFRGRRRQPRSTPTAAQHAEGRHRLPHPGHPRRPADRRRRGALAERDRQHRRGTVELPNIEQDPYAVFDVNAPYDVTERDRADAVGQQRPRREVLCQHRLLQHGDLRRRDRRRADAARPLLTVASAADRARSRPRAPADARAGRGRGSLPPVDLDEARHRPARNAHRRGCAAAASAAASFGLPTRTMPRSRKAPADHVARRA